MDSNLEFFGTLIILVFILYAVLRDARKRSSRPSRYHQSYYGSDQGDTPDGGDFSDSSLGHHEPVQHHGGWHHSSDSSSGHHGGDFGSGHHGGDFGGGITKISVNETIEGNLHVSQAHVIEKLVLYNLNSTPLATYTASDYNPSSGDYYELHRSIC